MPRGQWEAIEADLVPMGYTLGDIPERLNWRAFWNWLARAPQSSNVYLLRHGKPARWGDLEYMTAMIVDYLALNVWMKTKDGAANRRRPDLLPRPGEETKTTRMGDAHMTIAEMDEWLGW